MARDLEWFDIAPEHDGHVCIVGGGPSLKDCLGELKWRKDNGQKVVALNGSARFLQENGIVPDAVVIADARPENVGFLTGITAYLASQCHPILFDASLKTILWHVNTEGMVEVLKSERDRPVHLIGGGSTVGMNAIVLMFAAGYRKIHLYGFDSSYREDSHHAYGQMLNDGDRVIDALYRDTHFKTTSWMAQQVNEFQDLVPGLVSDGCIITVAGSGLLPTVAADMVDNMPPSPAEQRANAVLSRVNGAYKPKGVEVGVFAGDMSRALLRMNPDLHLTMVDSWEGDGAAYTGDSGDFHAGLPLTAQEDYYRLAAERTEFAKARRAIIRKRSVDAARDIPDGSLDFVFIDADHSYSGCVADIAAWTPKLKPGGLLSGHDYDNPDFEKFGVKRAVDELGLETELGDNLTWFIRLPTT